MNLAYFLVTGPHLAGPLVWIVNILIYLVVALIIWFIVRWAAAEFGVPAKLVQLFGLLLFLLLILSLFAGCTSTTTTFPDGRTVKTTSQDPAVVSAIVTGVTNGAIQAGTAYLRNEGGLSK